MQRAATGFVDVVLALSGCSSPLVSTIASVSANHETLSGKRVKVVGWLRYCQRLSCSISELPGDEGQRISIGASDNFDRSIAPYRGIEIQIEIEGIVDPDCFDHSADLGRNPNLILVCTDRANELRDPRLLSVLEQRPLNLN